MKKDQATGRKLQAKKTKHKIFHSAISLIDEHGYDNVTIEDISAKAGVSVGAFYHYYTSKSDILIDLYGQIDHYYEETVAPLMHKGDVFDSIRVYFEHYAMYQIKRGLDHVSLLISSQPEMFVDDSRYMFILFREVVERGQRNGEITDKISSHNIMVYYFVLLRGVLFDWCLHRGAYALNERLLKYVDMQRPVFAV